MLGWTAFCRGCRVTYGAGADRSTHCPGCGAPYAAADLRYDPRTPEQARSDLLGGAYVCPVCRCLMLTGADSRAQWGDPLRRVCGYRGCAGRLRRAAEEDLFPGENKGDAQ